MNHTIYVHTHPYKKGEKQEHSHSAKEMMALQQIAQMPFSDYAVEIFDLTILQPIIGIYALKYIPDFLFTDRFPTISLRAPPTLYF